MNIAEQRKEIEDQIEELQTQIEELRLDIQKLQLRCAHPHTYKRHYYDGSSSTYCQDCRKELHTMPKVIEATQVIDTVEKGAVVTNLKIDRIG